MPPVNCPVPFIVGVGRSGTTLLRLMLDAHPDIAIPPELNWFETVQDQFTQRDFDAETISAKILSTQSWPDLDISASQLREILSEHNAEDPGESLRKIYRIYAARFGKVRYGDKTPKNLNRMELIQKLLPEAHFIHLIRDGRDVALSQKSVWIGERESLSSLFRSWCTQIRVARDVRYSIPNYMELHYEDLTSNPEQSLQKICKFLKLRFDPSMLESHKGAADRLAELKDMQHYREISKTERQAMFKLTLEPPTTSRVGKWRSEISEHDLAELNNIGGPLLQELGYES